LEHFFDFVGTKTAPVGTVKNNLSKLSSVKQRVINSCWNVGTLEHKTEKKFRKKFFFQNGKTSDKSH
jgi:hypothetical protein